MKWSAAATEAAQSWGTGCAAALATAHPTPTVAPGGSPADLAFAGISTEVVEKTATLAASRGAVATQVQSSIVTGIAAADQEDARSAGEVAAAAPASPGPGTGAPSTPAASIVPTAPTNI